MFTVTYNAYSRVSGKLHVSDTHFRTYEETRDFVDKLKSDNREVYSVVHTTYTKLDLTECFGIKEETE